MFDTTGGLGQYFDLLVTTGGFSIDGMGADTIGLGTAVAQYEGIPDGYDQIVLTITTTLDSSQAGKTLCLDSSFARPAWVWKWMTSGGTVYPSWEGPHCYAISNTPCYAAGDIDNDGIALTVADIVYLLRYFLGEGPTPARMYEADLNGDCVVDTADFNLYIGVIEFGIGFLPHYPVPTCCHPTVVPLNDNWAMMSVSLSGPGAGAGDTILCGEPVTFDIRLTNNTSYKLTGISNGFRLYSPQGAIWSPPIYDTTGGIGSYLDHGVVLSGFGVDGMGEDTVAIYERSYSHTGSSSHHLYDYIRGSLHEFLCPPLTKQDHCV